MSLKLFEMPTTKKMRHTVVPWQQYGRTKRAIIKRMSRSRGLLQLPLVEHLSCLCAMWTDSLRLAVLKAVLRLVPDTHNFQLALLFIKEPAIIPVSMPVHYALSLVITAPSL